MYHDFNPSVCTSRIVDGPDSTNILCSSVSVAHTYGNVVSLALEYFRQLFPPDYFKTIHVSTKIPFRDRDKLMLTDKEFHKKRKPMFIMRPRIDLNDEDVFMHGTHLTSTIFTNPDAINFGELEPFFEDPEKQVYIKYKLNRLVINFDINIVLSQQMEQINIASYLKNKLQVNMPFPVQSALESNIDKEVLMRLSKDVGIPMYDEKGSCKEFLDYLNSHSYFPITHKLKTSTGNDEFFRYYPTNVEFKISEIALDESSRRNNIVTASPIPFTCRCEFWAAGMYYYFTRNDVDVPGFDISMSTDNPSDDLIPIFTISNLFEESNNSGIWKYYNSLMFDVESTERDDIYIPETPLFTDQIINTIRYGKYKSISPNEMVKIVIMKDNFRLFEDIDYEIDWNAMSIKIINCEPNSTYRIITHINLPMINDLSVAMSGLDKNSDLKPFVNPEKRGDNTDKEILKVVESAERKLSCLSDEIKLLIQYILKEIDTQKLSEIDTVKIKDIIDNGNFDESFIFDLRNTTLLFDNLDAFMIFVKNNFLCHHPSESYYINEYLVNRFEMIKFYYYLLSMIKGEEMKASTIHSIDPIFVGIINGRNISNNIIRHFRYIIPNKDLIVTLQNKDYSGCFTFAVPSKYRIDGFKNDRNINLKDFKTIKTNLKLARFGNGDYIVYSYLRPGVDFGKVTLELSEVIE